MNNVIDVKIIQVQFPNNPMNSFDIPKLRGFFTTRYPKCILIHNHLSDGRFKYGYPSIQFKTINRIPTLIGLAEGFDVLKMVFQDVDELIIDGEKNRVWEKTIQMRMDEFGQTGQFYDFQFIVPWMALKEENFTTFKTLNKIESQQFLRHLLRENLRRFLKALNTIYPQLTKLKWKVILNPAQ
jgi:hypothetical protein